MRRAPARRRGLDLDPAVEAELVSIPESRIRFAHPLLASLFLSTRTVEGHLSRVYGKLGVRSRVELARRLES